MRTSLVGAFVAASCCALPTLLVAVGFGGAVASLVSAVPGVTFLSAHKLWVFAVVGALLLASWAAVTGRVPTSWVRARVCPTGAAPGNVRRLWRLTAVLYLLALGVAYLGAPVARWIWG
ncbi:MAG: hypothetical protein HY561_09780 [Gemmatimonadetes bacterium]|nr:hypothetical protein [Gemmatimonadota bacterium]